MQTRIFRAVSLIVTLTLLAAMGVQTPRAVEAQVAPQANFPVYLPLIQKACTTGQTYGQGLAYKAEADPLRPAYNHADKNLELRGYAIDNSLNTSQKQIQSLYPASDPNTPNLHTLFNPSRIPTVINVYDVYDWDWHPAPDPGVRKSNPVNTVWPITVIGAQVTPGETIRTPNSGYDLGQGVAAIVLYAAPNRITIHYTREDTVAVGYSIHIEDICVDANLLALYNSLESAGRYSQPSFNLVTLTALQPIGTALGSEMRIVIRDTGGFMDPRSLTDWWQ
jgi:hypothetical protein